MSKISKSSIKFVKVKAKKSFDTTIRQKNK